jgi:hypothetical protein
VIGEEASLDEASRPELAVIKRFALARSLRIEEIVTLSWPAGRLEEPRGPADAGQHYHPADRRDEATLRPLKGHHTRWRCSCLSPDRARNKAGEVIRAGATGWNSVASGFTDARRTAAKRMDRP